jgi:hypothetical protein
MKKNIIISSFVLAGLTLPTFVKAGNPERAGQAGAGVLLINPYARNSGWAGSNSAKVRGLEAQFLNIAGTAFTRKTEVLYNRTIWLQGTQIYMNTFGFTQGIGETGTIGLGLVALNAGRIEITTEDNPEGNIGTFNPTFYNLSFSYAKMFSDNIFGGVNVKLISEGISNATARGVAFDAGIQYHTGKYDQIHIGIALKNWGPKMRYQGDGLTKQAAVRYGSNYDLTVLSRSNAFELPALVNIGAAYDFYLTKDSTGLKKTHRVSLAGTFTSNSFTYDNYLGGLEYAWKEMFMVRAGLIAEKGIFSETDRRTVYTGPTAGATVELPFSSESKSTFGFDYSYRFTNPFGGTHTFGLRINL